MIKVYVAGKELVRAQKVIENLKQNGFQITYDWTTNYSDKNPKQKAKDELRGVQDADVLVYLWESDQESARYEAGMAMGLGKPIVVSCGPDAFFFKLPNVCRVDSDDKIIQSIEQLKKIFTKQDYPQ